MPIRKASLDERAEMTRLIREFIVNHGRGALKRAIQTAEIELTPPLTPYQQQQAEKRARWADIERELERERQDALAAAAAEGERQDFLRETRTLIHREMGICNGRTGLSLWSEWREMTVIREGLHKAIRLRLRAMGLVRSGPWFSVESARTMQPAVEAIIAWEARRLAMVSRRLEREGDILKARRDRRARRPVEEVRQLQANGVQIAEIARRIGMSRMSVYGILSTIAKERAVSPPAAETASPAAKVRPPDGP